MSDKAKRVASKPDGQAARRGRRWHRFSAMVTVLLIGVTVGALARDAHAAEVSLADIRYALAATSKPTQEGILWAAIHKADEFWRGKGYEPCEPRVLVFSFPAVVAVADMPGPGFTCSVWFDRMYLHAVKRGIRSRFRWKREDERVQLCATAVHERGHNLGFEHTPGTVMAKSLVAPGICYAWARETGR